jgi:hypothetical protein
MAPGMDDGFSFHTTQRQRRLDPRALKLAILAGVVVLVVGTFANWVIGSERASFARVRADASSARGPARPSAVTPGLTTDDVARGHAQIALVAAEKIVRTGTFADVSTARLAAARLGFTFVQGPSTEPQMISVASSRTAWAAAVMSDSSTCYYIRLRAGDAVTFGTGLACTGEAALGANDPSW